MQRLWLVGVGVAVAAALVAVRSPIGSGAVAAESAVVGSITDGDTLRLRDGRRVRLVQIDSPELGTGECYSRAARTALIGLVPPGTQIALEADGRLDHIDRYGRLLRYVHRGRTNVNFELVRRGAAAPWFYGGDRGRYAGALLRAARDARAAKRGLWRACPRTALDPSRAIATGASAPQAATSSTRCDPNYSGGCVPPYPPDVDCADIRALGIDPVRVVGADPHRLDGDHDGWGCE